LEKAVFWKKLERLWMGLNRNRRGVYIGAMKVCLRKLNSGNRKVGAQGLKVDEILKGTATEQKGKGTRGEQKGP